MKTINLEVKSVEKGKETNETELTTKNLKDIRKKLLIERKLKSYDPDIVPIQTKENSPSKNLQLKLTTEQKEQREARLMVEKISVQQNQKQTRSSVKLPNINSRNLVMMRPSLDNTIRKQGSQTHEVDGIIEKINNQGMLNNYKRKSLSRDCQQTEIEDEEKSNFLKYIQIRSMKPSQKIIEAKSDLSIRQIRSSKMEKISQKINKTKEDDSITKITLGRSEKIKFKRSQMKSQKSISSHSMNKQKKAISISKPMRRKIQVTNSYWDFCNFLCLLNRIEMPLIPNASSKAYIGKGNNSILIKNSLKNRFWWNIVDESLDVNLYWSQVRDNKFVQSLKCLSEGTKQQEGGQQETKKVQFYLLKQNTEKPGVVKDHVGSGFNKFLSNDEKKRLSKSNNQVQVEKDKSFRKASNPNKNRAHNHLQFFWHLSNKKALFYNLKKYYEAIGENPFKYTPLTFHIQKYGDQQWQRFLTFYEARQQEIRKKVSQGKSKKKKEKNLWIIKPGENSNQGCGIQVYESLDEITEIVKNTEKSTGRKRSYIVQKYLLPFLYNKRKFDIRTYVLFTSVNGIYKAYWYQQGYIRTSSKEFTLKNLKNRLIHLTNDAIQKKSEDYGKYENGNKLSYADFQKYLDITFPDKGYSFYNTVYPSMMKRAADAIKSACMLLDSNQREYSFQIFGLDFMIDDNFDTWLIEVNTNPCLDLGSPLLARIIPNMIQNSLKIAVDPLFPPPKEFPKTKQIPTEVFESNKFTLIFNSRDEQQILMNLKKDTNLSNIIESDEQEEIHDDECQY